MFNTKESIVSDMLQVMRGWLSHTVRHQPYMTKETKKRTINKTKTTNYQGGTQVYIYTTLNTLFGFCMGMFFVTFSAAC